MKLSRVILTGVLIAVVIGAQAHAADFNLTVSAGGAIPMGDFGKETDIIEPGIEGYSAVGGAASTGMGFNVEIEARVSRRIFLGGRFGYARHSADASDFTETIIRPLAPEVQEVDAVWTFSALGGFVRVLALDSPALDVYGRLGMGATKMKNTFDVTFDLDTLGVQTLTSDFAPGNRFYLAGAVGAEYRIWERAYLVAEIKLTQVFSDGAEATAYLDKYEITGTQEFATQTIDIMVGVRIPLSGI